MKNLCGLKIPHRFPGNMYLRFPFINSLLFPAISTLVVDLRQDAEP